MLPKPTSCQGCPAYQLGSGYVPGTGPQDAVLALVGQGPGEVEAHMGTPFSGPSGFRLDTWLASAKIIRSKIWVDNAVRCWLPDNREPTAQERTYCTTHHLWKQLASLPNLKVVVTVGTTATKAFLPKAGEKTLGAAIPLEEPWTTTSGNAVNVSKSS